MATNMEDIILRFREMRLPVMADELMNAVMNNELEQMTAIEILDRITSNELMSRKSNTIQRYLKNSKLSQQNASLANIYYEPERKLNEVVIQQLSTNDYISKGRNVLILGACGTGKSYIGNALGVNACMGQYRVTYRRFFELINELNNAKMENELERCLKKYTKPDVLILDDYLLENLNISEAANLFKLLEYRSGRKSTIFCSQLDPTEWHKKLGGSQLADAILDRIVPSAYKLILSGPSQRSITRD